MERSTIDALVQTASTLAAIQIEGVEDQTGFSNSDKFVGAFLAATVAADPTDEDNVRILAALVSRYRRQSEQMVGVDMFARFKDLAKDTKITQDDRDRARHIVLAAPGVHPKFGPQVVFAWNGFSYDYADAVKQCGAKAFKDQSGWKWALRADRAQEAAALLQDLGATIRGSLDVPEDLVVEKKTDALPNLIRVTKVDDTHLGIGWDYGNHARWNQIAKELPRRKFDWAKKLWILPLKDLAIAQDAFDQAGADVTQLKALAPQAPTLAQLMPDEPSYFDRIRPELMNVMDPYQIDGVKFLTQPLYGVRRALHSAEPKGMILGDDMGLGKTIQSIAAANAIADGDERMLVVCPAHLKLNWMKEIRKWGWGEEIEDVCIAEGENVEAARWMIVNYDILPRLYDKLIAIGFSVLICDEAHYTKNRESNRSRMIVGGARVMMPHEPTDQDPRKRVPRKIEGLAEYATKRVFLLTGTPMTNRPRDLFNLLKAVKHPLGRNFKFYGQRFCDPIFNGFGTTYNGAANLTELRERIAPLFLQRKKEDHLNLPGKRRDWMPVEVDLTAYQKVMDEYESRREAGELSRTEHHLALITEARVCAAIAKIPRTIEMIENVVEQGEKALVFTCRTEVVNQLMEKFEGSALKIDGNVTKAQRAEAERSFMEDEKTRILIGNLQAMGTGLNLTAATQVIVNDLEWVPANHLQAEDRAYRRGQTKMVNVTYVLAAGTFDEDLSVLLEEKFSAVQAFEGVDQGSLFLALVERLAAAPQNAGVKTLKAARKARKTAAAATQRVA